MKKLTVIALILALLLPCFSACGSENLTDVSTEAQKIDTVDANLTADTFDNAFMNYIAEHYEGNYMVSPLSFRYALGLLLTGAEGDTKQELLTALGVKSEEEWTEYCTTFNGFVARFAEELAEEVKEYQQEQGLKIKSMFSTEEEPFRALSVANSVWSNETLDVEFKEDYLTAVKKYYNAEADTFTADNAVSKINQWVSDKTEKMIEKLLPDGYNASALAMVLMNALYFKDSWKKSFSTGATEKGDFTTKNGTVTQKEFMTQTETFQYYSDEDTQLVILSMEGGISMAFVLGSSENLTEKIGKADYRTVKVTIPKLDMETSFSNNELVDFLKSRGVSLAFTDSADFSAMTDTPVCVDEIIQKTRIKLDEDGVEAAAVTAVMMKATSAGVTNIPVSFTADRPFTFYIYTTANDTTALLFSGRVCE